MEPTFTLDRTAGPYGDGRGPIMRYLDDCFDSMYNLTRECRAIVPMLLTYAGYFDYVSCADESLYYCYYAIMSGVFIDAPEYVNTEQIPDRELDETMKAMCNGELLKVRNYVWSVYTSTSLEHQQNAKDMFNLVDLFISTYNADYSMTRLYVSGM